jgi:hypothetical protein
MTLLATAFPLGDMAAGAGDVFMIAVSLSSLALGGLLASVKLLLDHRRLPRSSSNHVAIEIIAS